MSAGHTAVMLCGWGVKAGWPVINTFQSERFRDDYRTHCKAPYKCPVYFSYFTYSCFVLSGAMSPHMESETSPQVSVGPFGSHCVTVTIPKVSALLYFDVCFFTV